MSTDVPDAVQREPATTMDRETRRDYISGLWERSKSVHRYYTARYCIYACTVTHPCVHNYTSHDITTGAAQKVFGGLLVSAAVEQTHSCTQQGLG